MPNALIRPVSPKMGDCELTHLERQPIDVQLAEKQHAAYVKALQNAGCQIISAAAAPDLPDSIFVEDCCVVLDELAIITIPGAASRRPETDGIASALQPHRPLHFIQEPGILDGGDVLVIGKKIWAGLSSRSNQAAIEQMSAFVEPFGYEVNGLTVNGCLHLKSAVTQVAENSVLLNPDWIDAAIFSDFKIIETHPDEPAAANALYLNEQVIFPVAFPKTAIQLVAAGIEIFLVDNSEVLKAEGGVTCCSVIFN